MTSTSRSIQKSSARWSPAWFSTGGGARRRHVAVRAHAGRMRILSPLALAVALLCVAVPGAAAEEQPRGQWPLRPQPEVIQRFDPPDSPYGAGHRGVDLLGHVGQQVHAALGGTVTYAGMLAGRGVVVVSHGATRTTYEPVTATVVVGPAGRRGSGPSAAWSSPARTASRARACTGAGSPGTPTSTRSGWSGSARSGSCRSGGTSRVAARRQARGWAWRYAARSRSVVTWV